MEGIKSKVEHEIAIAGQLVPMLAFQYDEKVRENLALLAVHLPKLDAYETTQESANQLLQLYSIANVYQNLPDKQGYGTPELVFLFEAVIRYVNQNRDVLSRIANGSLISQGTPEFHESLALYADCLAQESEERRAKNGGIKGFRTNEDFFAALYGEDI